MAIVSLKSLPAVRSVNHWTEKREGREKRFRNPRSEAALRPARWRVRTITIIVDQPRPVHGALSEERALPVPFPEEETEAQAGEEPAQGRTARTWQSWDWDTNLTDSRAHISFPPLSLPFFPSSFLWDAAHPPPLGLHSVHSPGTTGEPLPSTPSLAT